MTHGGPTPESNRVIMPGLVDGARYYQEWAEVDGRAEIVG